MEKKDIRITEAFGKVKEELTGLKERLSILEKALEDVESMKERIAMLEEAQPNKDSQPFSSILTHSHSESENKKGVNKIEDVVIKKFKRKKKPEIINKIKELLSSGVEVIDIREDLVDRQRLIPTATFYRWIKKIKSENEMRISENQIEN